MRLVRKRMVRISRAAPARAESIKGLDVNAAKAGNMMLRFIEWMWGHKIGREPFVKSWWPSFDTHKPRGYDRRMLRRVALWEWGIAWPTLGDRKAGGTSQPIWNLTWLCNRTKRLLGRK